METQTVVETPVSTDVSAPDPDQAFINELFGESVPPPAQSTPDDGQALPSETTTETKVEATEEEHVQLSKADYMRLMTLEAQHKLKELDAPQATEAAEVEATTAPQTQAPAVPQGWTPEITPLPIQIDEKWMNVFAFDTIEDGNQYIGALVNTPYQKAAEYAQNAIAVAKAEMQQQIHAVTQNFGLFQAVNQILKDRPEYRGENMVQVELAAKEAIKADPTLTAWDLPDAIIKKLDASAKKAQQIMKSGGNINAVPKGGLKPDSTGARSPQDTGRSEPVVDPDLQFARDLGFPG